MNEDTQQTKVKEREESAQRKFTFLFLFVFSDSRKPKMTITTLNRFGLRNFNNWRTGVDETKRNVSTV